MAQMSDPIFFAISIGLLAVVAWFLVSVNEGQKQIAEGIAHIIGNPTERERKDATKLAQGIREEQAQAQASSRALIEQSIRQAQQQIELQQRTVFLLEQILAEQKDQSRQKAST
jgi:hypothetical protein